MENFDHTDYDLKGYLYEKYGEKLRVPYEENRPVQDCVKIDYAEIAYFYGEELLTVFEKKAFNIVKREFNETPAHLQNKYLIDWCLSYYLDDVFREYIQTEEEALWEEKEYEQYVRDIQRVC